MIQIRRALCFSLALATFICYSNQTTVNGQTTSTFNFSGTVGDAFGVPTDTGIPNAPDALANLIGQDFSISYSFDQSLEDLNVVANDGVFAGLTEVEVSVGSGLNLPFAVDREEAQIRIRNNGIISNPNSDEYRLSLLPQALTLDPLTGLDGFDSAVSLSLVLQDSNGNAITGEDLITDQLNPSVFDSALVGIQFQNDDGTDGGTLLVDLNGEASAIGPAFGFSRSSALQVLSVGATAVPEPTAILPIIIGLVGIGSRRRRKS